MTERPIRTVSWLNEFVRGLLSAEPSLSPILLEGEISGGKVYASGHYYFTLKDEQSQVSCVLFGLKGKRLDFQPQDGQRVVVDGQVTLYPPSGRYQINVRTMRLAGRGPLYERFLRLKEALRREGLFADEHKRALPRFPRRIGVVTSEKGAVLSDIIHVLRQRQPGFSLLLYPVAVQGETAAGEIAEAIALANRRADTDVLIVGRGGGSFEDLFAFNEEQVVRAIYESNIPVVSAVGHETDVTLSDFAADHRAPTPTAAAFAVSFDQAELLAGIRGEIGSLGQTIGRRLAEARSRFDRLAARPALSEPLRLLEVRQQRLDFLIRRLDGALPQRLERAGLRLKHLAGRLDDLGPKKVLARGYAIVSDAGGRVLTDAGAVRPGDAVEILLDRGQLGAEVRTVRPQPEDAADG